MDDIEIIQNRLGEIARTFEDELLTPEQAHALIEEAAELSAALERLFVFDEREAMAILQEEIYTF